MVMFFRRLAVAGAAALLLGATAGPAPDTRAQLKAAAAAYLAGVSPIARITGRDVALDYYQRLGDDLDLLDQPAPDGYSPAVWAHFQDAVARLDLDLVSQLMTQTYRPMASIRGLGETLTRSSKDGTMQPVAVYVPTTYSQERAAPLIVFLHGHPQSETELLAFGFVTDLAEKTGTIVVAPYGRAYYDFRGSESDVYDAYDAALKNFNVDARKRYLAGYSMGGFSVFSVAPVHPNDWAAVMCVSGSLLGSESAQLVAAMRHTAFYVLTGSKDDSIPTQFPTSTAIYLNNAGVETSFYSQPNGTHRLVTLLPILTQAWNDMETGTVRAPSMAAGGLPLPNTMPPANNAKP